MKGIDVFVKIWGNGEGRNENFQSLEVRGKLIALKNSHETLDAKSCNESFQKKS